MEDDYKDVFRNLIINPSKAFYDIIQYGLYKYKVPLLMLAGVTNALNKRMLALADWHENFFLNLITTVAIGAIAGWLGIFIVSWLVEIVGKWLKGQASFEDIFSVAAYATLPVIVMLASDLICIAILRSRGYAQNYRYVGLVDSGNINHIVLSINRYIGTLMNLYYLFLFVIGISVVQGFTKRKAALNLMIVVSGAVLLLGLLISLPFLLDRLHS